MLFGNKERYANLSFAMTFTKDACENKPYSLLLHVIKEFSKEEIQYAYYQYASALHYYCMLYGYKVSLNPDFSSIRKICRTFLELDHESALLLSSEIRIRTTIYECEEILKKFEFFGELEKLKNDFTQLKDPVIITLSKDEVIIIC
jgi:hypothetical protein